MPMAENKHFIIEPGNDEMFNDYAGLYNVVNGFENEEHIEYTPEYFRSAFSSSGMNLSLDVILARDLNGCLIGSGAIYLPEGSKKASLVIQVHPNYRRNGIGTKLFGRLYSEGKMREVEEYVIRALSYRPYSIAFAKHLGFCHVYSSSKMQLEFTDPVRPALHPWGFSVRALKFHKELKLWASLQNELFQGTPGYTRVTVNHLKSRSKHFGFDPNLILLGEVKDTPVGLCVGWTLPAQGKESYCKILQILGIGILPEYRRKGYGFSLLQEIMNRAYLKEHTKAELVVNSTNTAAIGMYLKHGFVKQYEHLWFSYPCN
jgi:mycothiol synthase